MLQKREPIRKEGAETYGVGDKGGDLSFLVLHILGIYVKIIGGVWISTGLVRAETDPASVLARLPSTSDDIR